MCSKRAGRTLSPKVSSTGTLAALKVSPPHDKSHIANPPCRRSPGHVPEEAQGQEEDTGAIRKRISRRAPSNPTSWAQQADPHPPAASHHPPTPLSKQAT